MAAGGLNGGITRRAQGSCTGASIEPRQQLATRLHLRRLVISLSELLRQRLHPQTVPADHPVVHLAPSALSRREAGQLVLPPADQGGQLGKLLLPTLAVGQTG